jgi:hypothetical protein
MHDGAVGMGSVEDVPVEDPVELVSMLVVVSVVEAERVVSVVLSVAVEMEDEIGLEIFLPVQT